VPLRVLLDNRPESLAVSDDHIMKCPKCNYLGFETGDRCRNCGYDFSLVATGAARSGAEPAPAPLSERMMPDHVNSKDAVDRLADMPLQSARLPLFTGASLDDEPLVRFPAAPRPPLSVRRTTEAPRFRPPVVIARRDEPDDEPSLDLEDAAPPAPASRSRGAARAATMVPMDPCPWGARISAAALDLLLLIGIDVVVFYFTLRMAALTVGEWRLLPPVPLILFLLLLKITYWFAFTAIGGQTIGKMAARIRVVSEDGPVVAPACAFRRTLAAVAAVVTLGATFLPALIGRERRAVHDRMARTRVVALPAA
jgi:uncharacterized RDD family membrane protein YckC